MINTNLYTKSGLLVAKGYERIVHGGRGDYIEITVESIIWESIYIPKERKWKVDNIGKIWYIEYRTRRDNVKVYFQKRLVEYADYKIGYFYISPQYIFTKDTSIAKYIKK